MNLDGSNGMGMKRTYSGSSTNYTGSGSSSQDNFHSKERKKKGKKSSGLSSFIKNQRKMMKQNSNFMMCAQY